VGLAAIAAVAVTAPVADPAPASAAAPVPVGKFTLTPDTKILYVYTDFDFTIKAQVGDPLADIECSDYSDFNATISNIDGVTASGDAWETSCQKDGFLTIKISTGAQGQDLLYAGRHEINGLTVDGVNSKTQEKYSGSIISFDIDTWD